MSEHAAQTECTCGFNCGYCVEDFRSVWSPHRWSVSVGCLPLGHIDKEIMFDRASGTKKLHCSKSCESFCAVIAVSRADSIDLTGIEVPTILILKNPFDMQMPKYLN